MLNIGLLFIKYQGKLLTRLLVNFISTADFIYEFICLKKPSLAFRFSLFANEYWISWRVQANVLQAKSEGLFAFYSHMSRHVLAFPEL